MHCEQYYLQDGSYVIYCNKLGFKKCVSCSKLSCTNCLVGRCMKCNELLLCVLCNKIFVCNKCKDK